MHRAHAAILGIALLLGGAACKRSQPAARVDLTEARALALAAPGGDGPVDRDLLSIQERLRQSPVAADWVLLGHTWIQKARRGGDPGLYLAADGAATPTGTFFIALIGSAGLLEISARDSSAAQITSAQRGASVRLAPAQTS